MDQSDDGPRVCRGGFRWHALESLVVFTMGVAIMHFIYGGADGVPGHDSFYHVKMAAMLPEHGLLRDFPWLRFAYFTDEGHGFVSHHYGFHALLAPFVHLSYRLTGDYLPGARWAMATFLGLSLVLIKSILVAGRVRWYWLWLLLFVFMPFQFFTRHAFVRAISPSLVFMLLIVLLMFRRRYVLTGLAIACYIHLYLGGVLYAPLLVGLYVLSSAVVPRGDREMPWKLLLWTAAGWLIGILTHPYSYGMWEFLKIQVFGSGLSPDISVGREWKPYRDLWWFAQMSGVLLVVWAVATCVRFRLGKPLTARELMLLLAHFIFLGLTFKARRFIEYWPAFCLLSSAFMAAPLLERVTAWCDRCIDKDKGKRAPWIYRTVTLFMIGGIFALVSMSSQWKGIRRIARCGYDLPAIREAMDFMRQHSEPGDIVFTDDWDIFPVYFYYNSHNYYIVGLDPKFTHARRPVLWERYVKISRGEIPATVSDEQYGEKVHVTLEDVREHFGARFVITDRDHKRLAGKLAARKDFAELVYPTTSYSEARNDPYLIFRIREQDGHAGSGT